MMLPKNIAGPLTVVATGAALAWGASAYLSEMRDEQALRDTAQLKQLGELTFNVELFKQDTGAKLARIDEATQRIEVGAVKETDLMLWIERARSKYPDMPEWTR